MYLGEKSADHNYLDKHGSSFFSKFYNRKNKLDG